MSATRSSEQVLSHLQRLDDYEFEHFVADLWERQGWTTSVSQASVDAGVDVTATKESPYPQKQLIQAKRYSAGNTVGGPAIQQYNSLRQQQENVDSVAVVTTSSFTSHARNRAQELNVKLIDGEGLVAMLEQHHAYDLLEKYKPASEGGTPTGGFGQTETARPTGAGKPNGSSGNIGSARSALRTLLQYTARVPADIYYRVIQASVALWAIGLVLGLLNVSGGAFAVLVGNAAVLAWVLSPFAFYHEAGRVAEETEWDPYRRLYAIASVLPFLVVVTGGIYLYRRHQAYARTGEESTAVAEPIAE
jgi:hypothetical protein